MKLSKIIASLTAAAAAVSAMAISAFAYDVNTDFKTGWTVNTTIPGTEFEGVTTDSVITFTYSADASLSEKAGHEYWCIKPMYNDAGWPFIADIEGLKLSDAGDSYNLDTEVTEVSFTLSADAVEKLPVCGMALMGHGLSLETMTISNDKSLADVLAEKPNYLEKADEDAAAEEPADEAAADETPAEDTAPAVNDAPASDSTTTTPTTGNAPIAVFAGAAILALAAAACTRKK